MSKYTKLFVLFLALPFLGTIYSCKKQLNLSKGNLDFSLDTLVFDTVFTTIGSTTKSFKFYNNDNSDLLVEEVELMGGANSPFRINVDGLKGTNFSNLEMERNDSLFVFVEVTLAVNNSTQPLVIQDSIRFKTNGKNQYVQLAVWGQDAYFHYKEIMNTQVWLSDKPHVIYDYAAIDEDQTLTIEAGTKIFMHKGALLWNFKGTLNIDGTSTNKVVFQGDRLEAFYQDIPGQFYGIYMQEAKPSRIYNTIIRNGTAGIHLFSKNPSFTDYTLDIQFSEIYNNSSHGIFLFKGPSVKAENCLIYKNGSHALLVLGGGDFNFNFCNLLGYNSSEQIPAVGISNYFVEQNGDLSYGNINEGTMTNSVISGNQDTEIIFNTLNPGAIYNLNYSFKSCLIQHEDSPTNPIYENIIWNQSPGFTDINENDYRPISSSPLKQAGNSAFLSVFDFGQTTSRNTSAPTIGAWE